jgi:hypothetical protein
VWFYTDEDYKLQGQRYINELKRTLGADLNVYRCKMEQSPFGGLP